MWDSLAIRPLRSSGVFLQSDPEVRGNLCGAPKAPPLRREGSMFRAAGRFEGGPAGL